MVPPLPSDIASSVSDDSHEAGQLPYSAYTASLRPLHGPSSGPDPGSASLAADCLAEQFERAQQYVLQHQEHFSAERLESLQVCSLKSLSPQLLY